MITYTIRHILGGEPDECYLAHYEKGKVITLKHIDKHNIVFCTTIEDGDVFEMQSKAFEGIREIGGYYDGLKYCEEFLGAPRKHIDNMIYLSAMKTGECGSSENELETMCNRIN